jgi:hypothetical protein
MNFIISIIFAVKSVLLFTGAVAPDKSAAFFDQPQIILTENEVKMTCSLHNAFPEELKKLAATGTEITLYLFVEVNSTEGLVSQTVVENKLRYDLIHKKFSMTKNAGDTASFSTLDSALAQACGFSRLSILPLSKVDRNGSYTIISYAVLGKALVEALENHSIDLMYYWNYKRPTIRTERIRGAEFFAYKKRPAS